MASLLTFTQPIIAKKQVSNKKPFPIKIGEEEFVVVKVKNEYFLYPQSCPHRGFPFKDAKLTKKGLVCPYHGWEFEPNGNIIHPLGIKKKCNSIIKLEEYQTLLWYKDKEPYPYFDNDYHLSGSKSFLMPTPFHILMENFNEGSHTDMHKTIGTKGSRLKEVKFDWEEKEDHILTYYTGPQRPSFIFNGPFWFTYLDYDVLWKTYFKPLSIEFISSWKLRMFKPGKKFLLTNKNYYFLSPHGNDQTYLHAVIKSEKLPIFLRFIQPLFDRISLYLTSNQVSEDIDVCRKMANVDVNFTLNSKNLDKFDVPLLKMRKKAKETYNNYI